MAAIQETNSASEIQRLLSVVKSLQTECQELRIALAHSEEERERYLKAVYRYERGRLDMDDLRRLEEEGLSAGPVELLQ